MTKVPAVIFALLIVISATTGLMLSRHGAPAVLWPAVAAAIFVFAAGAGISLRSNG